MDLHDFMANYCQLQDEMNTLILDKQNKDI